MKMLNSSRRPVHGRCQGWCRPRGSIVLAFLVVLVLSTLAVTLLGATVSLNEASRAASLRTVHEQTLTSLRGQVIGGLNAGTVPYDGPVTYVGCADPTKGGSTTGVDGHEPGPFVYADCARVSLSDPAPDNATATGNLMIDVTVSSWQLRHWEDGSTYKIATVSNSFQAYGTCVVGYVPGTGDSSADPVVYPPCRTSTPVSKRHLVWVDRDSSSGP